MFQPRPWTPTALMLGGRVKADPVGQRHKKVEKSGVVAFRGGGGGTGRGVWRFHFRAGVRKARKAY